MRAVFKETCTFGNSNSTFIVEENSELPPLGKFSVLIEIKACALSDIDEKLMKLLYQETPDTTKYPVGIDISGIVRRIGKSVNTVGVGDEVSGIIPLDYYLSGCADYVVLHEFDITRKPDSVSFVDAAGCIGDAVKAYTALHYLGRMTAGDTVLVMDGASSFGSLCIQLAYHWGGKVITTVSSEDEKLYVESLENQLALVIDLTSLSSKFKHTAKDAVYEGCMEETSGLGVDLIIDNGVTLFSNTSDIENDNYTFPTATKHEIISALAIGGRWITSKEDLQLDPPDSRLLFMKCASVGFLFEQAWTLSSTHQGRYLHILMDIMEKVDHGIIRPNIHHTVTFDSTVDAMKSLSEVRVGKVVMMVD